MSFSNHKKYTCLLLIQHLLILFDICVNSFSLLARSNPSNLLIIFIVQDFCLIIAFIIFLVNLFSTPVFQAGLIQFLFVQFRITLFISVLYIILSICLHTWYMKIHYYEPLKHYWPASYHWLYSIHRITAVLYYCLTKKASLQLSHPKFYRGSKVVQQVFSLT